jgi:signal transduction histidine kinase
MKTFTQRLTLRFAALVTVTTAAVLAVGGWLLDRQMLRGLEALHEGEFRELRALLGGNGVLAAEEISRRIRRDAENDAAFYFVQVHSDRGEILFRSANLGANVLPDLSGRELHWTVELPGIGPVHTSEYHEGSLHVQVASPLAPVRRLLADYFEVAALLMVGVAALSVALGYAFSRITLRPLRAIEATANRIRSDNLSERIPVHPGDDEVASLTRLLNQMFDRLQASFEQVRRFAADVSHEVKTPLALIRLNAEKLRPRLATDADGSVALADILEEIDQINQVTDRLLFLAKSESGALKPTLRPVSPPALLAPLAEDAQVLAADRGVRFALALDESGEIRADPELLRQMLLNLVANAV